MARVFVLLSLASLWVFAGNANPVTVLPDEAVTNETGVLINIAHPEDEPKEPENSGADFIVGEVDTVGGTTYDWLANGPVYRMICNSPEYGVHVLWMYSASTSGTAFPDRNMRYNFYDYATGDWNWLDPDFMASGVNVFTDRSGYGSIDADPNTGVAICSRHFGAATLSPGLARDMAPGGGIFEYCNGPEGYLWPPVCLDESSWCHIGLLDDPGRLDLFYTRVKTWGNWDNPSQVATINFPTQNIAASKVSQRVCLAWVVSNSGAYSPGYYNISTDGGTNWLGVTQLPEPPAYGPDTVCSFHITSMFPYYDRNDRLHIVAAVMPFVGGTGYVIPADIWHWCPENTPNWSRVTRATCDPANLQASVGYNALYACRASIGEDEQGGLYVAWEQFDSSNVEPQTNLLRADIFYSQDNGDNGQTWNSPVKITDRGTVSHRFPSCIDYLHGDTLYITYEIDLVAGFYVQGQGPVTRNPIVVHKVPVTVGIGSKPEQRPRQLRLTVAPNPVRGSTNLRYSLPQRAKVRLRLFDLSGRTVAKLVEAEKEPGWYSVAWDGRGVPPGVYLVRLDADGRVLTAKLVQTGR
ncbi:MAG: T9SS type A sorting domain-containing protein [bacterium]